MRRFFITKSRAALVAEAESGQGFRRVMGTLDLIFLGVGVAIGSGVFVLTGQAAASWAGPAVSLSFALAALGAGFGALCYAEMASMLPVSGSAYAYAYATFGEVIAFLIGWDLILEYLVGAAVVAVGWSGYLTTMAARLLHIDIPPAWSQAPWTWNDSGRFVPTGCYFNVPAALIVLTLTAVLVRGVRQSSRLNAALVVAKTCAILLFLVVSYSFIDHANWHPFVPRELGWSGVLRGASVVVFAYLGIDNLTTAALETKDPQRSLPRAIIVTLGVCALLYGTVGLVLTGVVHYSQLGVPNPIAVAAAVTGVGWLQNIVEVGALAGLTSVMLVQLYGQPRIFCAMAQDGLLPARGARIHARFGTPHVATVGTGVTAALSAGLVPLEVLAELCSVGTLFAFILVSAGVAYLRWREPAWPRRFRLPFGMLIPALSMLICGFLMFGAGWQSVARLTAWLLMGLCVYFLYGAQHSRLRRST